jgi:hypothetical protein
LGSRDEDGVWEEGGVGVAVGVAVGVVVEGWVGVEGFAVVVERFAASEGIAVA